MTSFHATFVGPDDATHTVGAPVTDEAGRRCAMGFNPGNHAPTAKIKGFCAAAMQAIIDERNVAKAEYQRRCRAEDRGGKALHPREHDAYHDAMRNFATALTQIDMAQKMGVMGLHVRANAGITVDVADLDKDTEG